MRLLRPVRALKEDGGVGAEFINHLATGSAGSAGDTVRIRYRDSHDFQPRARPSHGGKDCGTFRTIGHAVGGILDIATGEQFPVAGEDGGSDPELGIRRVCILRSQLGGTNQLLLLLWRQLLSHMRSDARDRNARLIVNRGLGRRTLFCEPPAGSCRRAIRSPLPVVNSCFMPASPKTITWQAVAAMIDHTNLRPEATGQQITELCAEARRFGFGAVMVNASYIALACSELRDSDVKVGAVIGFPLGATLTSVKKFEAEEALKAGAREIDMVINVGALKSGNLGLVRSDIGTVADAVHQQNALVKVIIETVLLSNDEKVSACKLSTEAGADFVKTSTGFLGGGATVADVALMRRAVGSEVGVKASGGIRTAADALAMIEAGANRLGTSSGVAIVRELQAAR